MGVGKREFGAIGWGLVVLWLVGSAVASKLLFRSGKDAKFKKKYLPSYIVSVYSFFALLLLIYVLPLEGLLLLVPVLGVLGWLNIRNTTFCEHCCEQNTGMLFRVREYCSRCGGKL